jgi:hypothetical protein
VTEAIFPSLLKENINLEAQWGRWKRNMLILDKPAQPLNSLNMEKFRL